MTDDGRQTIDQLAMEVLPTLIERLTNSELGELEVRENGWRIRLRRPVSDELAAPPAELKRPHASGGGGAGQPGERSQASRIEREPARGVVTAPAVGYFVPRDGVAVGSRVQSGDILGHVDVLGVRQEIVAATAGVLRALDVEPGQAVEYGQPIARVDQVTSADSSSRTEAIRVEPELAEALVGSSSADVQ